MNAAPRPDFWQLWSVADDAGARRLHLTVGRPPLARTPGGELAPVAGDEHTLAHDDVMRLLSMLVEPEAWTRLERTGDGDVSLISPDGRRVRLTVFRANASQTWSAVAAWG